MQRVRECPLREWRGACFLSTRPRDTWSEELSVLWRHLSAVAPWPTDYGARVRILTGIALLVPGNLLWHYANGACFKCSRAGHVASECTVGSEPKALAKPPSRKRKRSNTGGDSTTAPLALPSSSPPRQSAAEDGDDGEAPRPLEPTVPPPPHELLQRGGASKPERTRAASQARKQGLNVPRELRRELPEGWAIAKCGLAGQRGIEFTARCKLAQAHCINALGGDATDAILYTINGSANKKGSMRALLSAKGVDALAFVTEHVPIHKLAGLSATVPPCWQCGATPREECL